MAIFIFENVLQTTEVYRPFPGSKNPRFQNEAKSKTFLMKTSFIHMRIKNIFMSMASHIASLWNRGLWQLGDGLLAVLSLCGEFGSVLYRNALWDSFEGHFRKMAITQLRRKVGQSASYKKSPRVQFEPTNKRNKIAGQQKIN